MSVSDYLYELPEDLIAQTPLARRDASRMMVVSRSAKSFCDSRFDHFPDLLSARDVLVINNTRVFPARLFGVSETGARVETFLISEVSNGQWEALARPAKRIKPGAVIAFENGLAATVGEILEGGRIQLKFNVGDLFEALDSIGQTPLPPYIKRSDSASDRARYQTVYARNRGAIAAPTAGLHFTDTILEKIRDSGVTVVEITLHVGYGTFEPVRTDDLSQHSVSPEKVEISTAAADLLNSAKSDGRRIIAVGTTSTRALEWNIAKYGMFAAANSAADLTIRPGYRFRAIDGLLTNFHLPKSSLLILVSTFAGKELIMKTYEHAVSEHYRFYSYGDCMFIV